MQILRRLSAAIRGRRSSTPVRQLREAGMRPGPALRGVWQALAPIRAQNRPVTDDDIEVLRAALQRMTLSDFGLPVDPRKEDMITYLTVHEDSCHSLCCFFLPSGASLPLHDHPGMHVLQKVLYGDVHVRGFDWTECAEQGGPGKARLVYDRSFCESDPCLHISPGGGGVVHEVSAAAGPAAFFDIISPPYSLPERDCTYYDVLGVADWEVGVEYDLVPVRRNPPMRRLAL
eukprot:TRINITY_DN2146_c0_g1_i1.p1 TRINITY_DN2146_c0_g1~~TRINITY_DN2146_c0_g1_i1.p1  ORF type:complete len:231 (+),score=51.73 TRINITY_DN2146_c0_g1_i1:406-1098(+)